jgi:hypothetical protein
MMVLFRFTLFGMLAFAVSCSGNGSSSGALDDLGDDGDVLTDPGILPITGRATYSGFLSLNLPSGLEVGAARGTYSGDLSLTVDFASDLGAMTGQADGFSGPSGDSVLGRVYVTNGILERSTNTTIDYTFEAGISGTLSGDGLRNSVISGSVSGDFKGQNASSISGVAYGNVTTYLGVDVFDGTFSGAKN